MPCLRSEGTRHLLEAKQQEVQQLKSELERREAECVALRRQLQTPGGGGGGGSGRGGEGWAGRGLQGPLEGSGGSGEVSSGAIEVRPGWAWAQV